MGKTDCWQDIRSIPTDRPVLVKTVTGIVTMARTYPVYSRTRWVMRPKRQCPFYRVSCYRLNDDGKAIGDVRAIAWRELQTPSPPRVHGR